MTPSELADRLQNDDGDIGADMLVAAAMLREAERLLHLSMARSGNLRGTARLHRSSVRLARRADAMTPSELADRLEKRWEAGARASTEELDYAAAAMLREAERLLRGTYRRDDQWVSARHAWLDGQTP